MAKIKKTTRKISRIARAPSKAAAAACMAEKKQVRRAFYIAVACVLLVGFALGFLWRGQDAGMRRDFRRGNNEASECMQIERAGMKQIADNDNRNRDSMNDYVYRLFRMGEFQKMGYRACPENRDRFAKMALRELNIAKALGKGQMKMSPRDVTVIVDVYRMNGMYAEAVDWAGSMLVGQVDEQLKQTLARQIEQINAEMQKK